jgi:hypothetical protein
MTLLAFKHPAVCEHHTMGIDSRWQAYHATPIAGCGKRRISSPGRMSLELKLVSIKTKNEAFFLLCQSQFFHGLCDSKTVAQIIDRPSNKVGHSEKIQP